MNNGRAESAAPPPKKKYELYKMKGKQILKNKNKYKMIMVSYKTDKTDKTRRMQDMI